MKVQKREAIKKSEPVCPFGLIDGDVSPGFVSADYDVSRTVDDNFFNRHFYDESL